MLMVILIALGIGGAGAIAFGYYTDRVDSRWPIALGILALLVALAGVPIALIDTWYRSLFG
ncbi:hypothetical protein [Marinactinospora rubrisoli]|uniref:Major facilitator superfamily (MFS) profile domain-containing protein n=1 Tax=Marinactinospora rubrisoli TaxID=2715399 RepID=A0ABW2KK20_9ACTN